MTLLDVTCSVEGDYPPHSAAMLHSVLEHIGGLSVRVHYLHGPDFEPDARRRLKLMMERAGTEIRFVYVDDELCAGLPTKGFTGKATWYRTMLPDLLPDVGRVLSLDVDLIVADSLEPLAAIDLGDHLLAAVTNVMAPIYMTRPAELGLDPRQYFNAGVMLMNLELMRARGSAEQLRKFAVTNAGKLVLRDQDALNRVLARDRLALHPRWNCMSAVLNYPWAAYVFSPQEIEEARSRPAIRHFEGPADNKPWHPDCPHGQRGLYMKHRSQTPWPRLPEPGRMHAIPRRVRGLRRRLRP